MRVTRRQSEILRLIADGKSDKEIAAFLAISFRTVRTHLERLYAINGIRGRATAVALWLNGGDPTLEPNATTKNDDG